MRSFLSKTVKANVNTNNLDTGELGMYNSPITSQKVGDSGGKECSTGNTNTALTEKVGSLSPPNSERYSKKIMWSDFLSLEVLIRVSLYSRKMNGRNRKPDLNRFRSRIARRDNLIGSIFPEPAKLTAIDRGEYSFHKNFRLWPESAGRRFRSPRC